MARVPLEARLGAGGVNEWNGPTARISIEVFRQARTGIGVQMVEDGPVHDADLAFVQHHGSRHHQSELAEGSLIVIHHG